MIPAAGDVIRVMERNVAPPGDAEKWDHAGLVVGHGQWPASLVWVALDPLSRVVDQAIEAGAGMLITHHPLLFQGIHGVDLATPTGRILGRAIENKMAIYCAHTNLDKARGGTNDLFCQRLALSGLRPLGGMGEENPEGPWLAATGVLEEERSLIDLARFVKDRIGAAGVRMAGPEDLPVSRVAVVAGSGGSLVPEFLASDAQVLITGDLKYHEAQTLCEHGRGLIDAGHFASEHLVVRPLAGQLSGLLEKEGYTADVFPCLTESDPFVWI